MRLPPPRFLLRLYSQVSEISIAIASCWADDGRWAVVAAGVVVENQDMIGWAAITTLRLVSDDWAMEPLTVKPDARDAGSLFGRRSRVSPCGN